MCDSCILLEKEMSKVADNISLILSRLDSIDNHLEKLNGRVATNVSNIQENHENCAVMAATLELMAKSQEKELDRLAKDSDKTEERGFQGLLRNNANLITMILVLLGIVIEIFMK